MKPSLRISPQTIAVLEALLYAPTEWRYGYDLSRETKLKSGTLYPILMRLADNKLMETKWEASPETGRPPRHLYRLTGQGVRVAREKLAEVKKRPLVTRPAFLGGSS